MFSGYFYQRTDKLEINFVLVQRCYSFVNDYQHGTTEPHLTNNIKNLSLTPKMKPLSYPVAVLTTCKHQVWFGIERSKTESKDGMTIGQLMQNMNYSCGKHKTNSKGACGRVDNQMVGRNFNRNGGAFYEIMLSCPGY